METNEKGEVAMKYFQPTNKYLRVGGEVQYREYMFRVGAAGISMAWVKPEDVPLVLDSKQSTCCSGAPSQVFRLANAQDVRIWSGISDR